MRVEVPEYETFIDFPDDTAPDEMERVLAESFPTKATPAPAAPAPDIQNLQGTPTTGGYVPPPRSPGEPAPVYAKPDPSVTYAGALEAAGRAIPSAATEIVKAVGGGMRAIGENFPISDPGNAEWARGTAAAGKNVTDFYGSLSKELASRNKNELERTVHGGLTSAGISMATYPLAALKGPNVALALMGLIEQGSSYAEMRDAGVSPGRALPASAMSGAVEAITEKTGLDVIMDKALAPFQKLVKDMAVEMFTESGATAYQTLIDLAAKNPDLTLGEFSEKVIPALYDTWKQTPIAAGAQVGMYEAATRANAKIQEWKTSKERAYYTANQEKQAALNQYSKRKAEEAGPGPAPAPPGGAPPVAGDSIITPPAPTSEATPIMPPEPSEPPPAAPTLAMSPAIAKQQEPRRATVNESLRKHIQELSQKVASGDTAALDELQKTLMSDPVSGAHTKRAFEIIEQVEGPAPVISSMDVKGLHAINNTFGHDVGNQYLKLLADIHREEGIPVYRYGDKSDEFLARFQTKELALEAKQRISDRFKDAIIEVSAGDTKAYVTNWEFYSGIGGRENGKTAHDNAFAELYAEKARVQSEPGYDRTKFPRNLVILNPAEFAARKKDNVGQVPPAAQKASAQEPAKAEPVKPAEPAALPNIPTPEQTIPENRRVSVLSEAQRNWLEVLLSDIGTAEAKKYVTQKAGEDEAIGWTGAGFDHIREGYGLQGFEFNRKVDMQAIRKALEGKTLGVREASRVREFLQAWYDRTSREGDFIGSEPVDQDDEVPFDLFNGEPEAPKQKKAKPVQQKLNMGQVKGEDLKAPEKKGKSVDINETELGKATNEAKDRQAQEKMFDIAGQYSEQEATRSRAAFETPEIVRLIKKLTGQYPKVAPGQIKTAMGIALGFYEPSSKSITVSEKSAEVEALVKRVLAHEFGHRVHHIGDPETMKRGNILGIIAGFRKYMKKTLPEYQGAPDEVLSQQDRSRLRSEAEKEARRAIKAEKAAGEAEGDLLAGKRKVSPEEIKAIWNDVAARDKDPDLYDYISRLTAAQKKAVLIEAMRGVSNVEFQRQIHDKKYSDLDEKIKEIFKKKIKEEIEKRKLYDAEVITEELKQIVRLIKPFNENDPKMVKYRFSPTELYADGTSMVLVDPEFVKSTAPNFWKAFQSWKDARPEFKAEYDKIVSMLEGDREALLQDYQDEINKGYDAHESAIKKQIEQSKIGSLHDVYSHLVDQNAAYWKLINKKEKEGVVIPPDKDPRYWLTEVPYSNAEVYVFLKTVFDEAGRVLQKNGIDNATVGNFFQHMRVVNERSNLTDEQGNPYTDKANPHGHTKASSQNQLDKMKRDMGAEKYAVLEQAYNDIQKAWQELVIKPIRESGMWSDALLKYAEANKYYAKFRTVENFSDSLDDHFGGGDSGAAITGHVFRRHGSFQDIANPYIQTMLTGAQLIRAAHVNQAKKFSVEFLLRNYRPNEITRAKQKWNGKFKETKILNNERVGTVIYLEGGKPQAFYVKREIADIINSNSEQASRIVNLMQMAVAPVKAAQVKYNVLWAMRNVVRDFLGSFKKAAEIKDPLTLAYWYLRALPHALRDVSGRPLNDTLRFLYKNKFLAPDRLWGTVDRNEVDELQHMMETFGLSDVHYRNKVLKPLMKVFATVEGVTKFSERMSKIAGGLKNKQLVERGERTKKEASYSVREFWGTPNVLRRGIWGRALNAGFVYSNVNVQDLRSSLESAKNNPFIYGYKTILMNVLPAVITAGLAAGWFRHMMDDDEDEAMKEWYRKISNYQKDRYMNIPLGFDSKGKAVGMKVPMDFTGTAGYGTVLAGLEGRYGNNGMFRTMWEQNPYLSPMLVDFATDMADAVRGRELYDDFRGRPAIDPDINKVGGSRKAGEIAKYEWNKLGGSTIYRFNTDDPSRIKSDLEQNLQEWPGKLASSFFFVSDYGVKESARETQEQVEQKKASKRIDIKDAIQEDIKANAGKPSDTAAYDLWDKLVGSDKIDPTVTKPKQFAATYDRYMRGGADNARLETLMRSDVDGKLALMEKYQKELSEEKYRALEVQALEEGLLKRSFWKKSALRQRP